MKTFDKNKGIIIRGVAGVLAVTNFTLFLGGCSLKKNKKYENVSTTIEQFDDDFTTTIYLDDISTSFYEENDNSTKDNKTILSTSSQEELNTKTIKPNNKSEANSSSNKNQTSDYDYLIEKLNAILLSKNFDNNSKNIILKSFNKLYNNYNNIYQIYKRDGFPTCDKFIDEYFFDSLKKINKFTLYNPYNEEASGNLALCKKAKGVYVKKDKELIIKFYGEINDEILETAIHELMHVEYIDRQCDNWFKKISDEGRSALFESILHNYILNSNSSYYPSENNDYYYICCGSGNSGLEYSIYSKFYSMLITLTNFKSTEELSQKQITSQIVNKYGYTGERIINNMKDVLLENGDVGKIMYNIDNDYLKCLSIEVDSLVDDNDIIDFFNKYVYIKKQYQTRYAYYTFDSYIDKTEEKFDFSIVEEKLIKKIIQTDLFKNLTTDNKERERIIKSLVKINEDKENSMANNEPICIVNQRFGLDDGILYMQTSNATYSYDIYNDNKKQAADCDITLSKLSGLSNKRKGFTLIEILAVIVILSILIAIAVPSIQKIISNYKKKAFISDAILYVDNAKLSALVNSNDNEAKIYRIQDIKVDKGNNQKSSFNEYWKYQYIIVMPNGNSYVYIEDMDGNSIAPKESNDLDAVKFVNYNKMSSEFKSKNKTSVIRLNQLNLLNMENVIKDNAIKVSLDDEFYWLENIKRDESDSFYTATIRKVEKDNSTQNYDFGSSIGSKYNLNLKIITPYNNFNKNFSYIEEIEKNQIIIGDTGDKIRVIYSQPYCFDGGVSFYTNANWNNLAAESLFYAREYVLENPNITKDEIKNNWDKYSQYISMLSFNDIIQYQLITQNYSFNPKQFVTEKTLHDIGWFKYNNKLTGGKKNQEVLAFPYLCKDEVGYEFCHVNGKKYNYILYSVSGGFNIEQAPACIYYVFNIPKTKLG